MTNDKTNIALAWDECSQLLNSERGRGALVALNAMLAHDATYSLDFENQAALSNLLQRALATPSVRDLIAERLGIVTC